MKSKIEGKTGPAINEKIAFDKMHVISHEGKNLGILSKNEALKIAAEHHLDLVLMSDTGGEGYPVAKIMDFGKALYAKKKQVADAKKQQKTIEIKELKLRPKIGEHDYQTKINQAIQFLKSSKHVKITLMFKGRESINLNERGLEFFDKINQSFQEAGLNKLAQEKDSRSLNSWSRIYYLKK